MTLQLLDMEAIEASAVQPSPFPYAVIPQGLVKHELPDLMQDFPVIEDAGSFPLSTVTYGQRFDRLIQELTSDEFRDLIAQKFSMDLSNKPVMITVRGKADHTDGRIHTDSKSKLITVLLYMNEDWHPEGGKLRLLHDDHNLENYFAEISPTAGSLLIFKVTDNGWHGHKTFIGTRKVIQLNYVVNEGALNKHAWRHRLSAKFKKFKRSLLGQNKHACPHC